MARLPVVDGDDGSWGTILNEFLAVEHNGDGTLKRAADITDAKQKADSSVQSVNGKFPTSGVLTLGAADIAAAALDSNGRIDITALPTARGVYLDAFTGASDDDKLTAAMAYASAQSIPPPILLSAREHTFSSQRTPYQGFRLVGPLLGITNSELANASMVCKVNLTTNGTWLYVNGTDAFDCFIGGISFVGTTATTFLGCDGTAIWHCSHLRDVSFHNFQTVLGTQARSLLMTASIIDGWFQVAGTAQGGIHIGGSDNRLFTNGALIDAATSINTVPGQFHIWLDRLDNSVLGPIYVTAEGPWGGVKVSGVDYNSTVPTNLGMVELHGPVIEGRSAAAPCDGSLLRIEGGIVKIFGGYIARAMQDPASMGHSPRDNGAIHVTSGALLLEGATYDRYTGQAESSPMLHQSGGNVRIRNIYVATKGGVWAGLPQVLSTGGTLSIDDSVTQNTTILRIHHHDGVIGTSATASSEAYTSPTGTAPVYVANGISGQALEWTSGSTAAYFQDTSGGGYVLFWLRAPSLPTSDLAPAEILDASATPLGAVVLTSTGSVKIYNGLTTLTATSALTVVPGTWYWLAWHVDSGAQELRIGTANDMSNPLETVTGSAVAGSMGQFRIGNPWTSKMGTVGDKVDIDEVWVGNNWLLPS